MYGEGRAEGTTKNTESVKACPTDRWFVSQPTSSPVTWRSCDPSYPLEAGAQWPWGCAGVPVSPWALGSAERFCTSFKPSSPSAGNCFPSAGGAGWGGLSTTGQHQHSSLTTSCKPSWGRFLLRFLPPAVLLALGWRQRPPPGCIVGPWAEGMEIVAGTAT